MDLFGVLTGCLAAIGIIYVWSPIADVAGWIRAVVTLVGLMICLVGFLYPVRQFLTRAIAAGKVAADQKSLIVGRMLLGASLAGVALLGTWGSIQWAPKWAAKLMPNVEPVKNKAGETVTPGINYFAAEKTQAATAIGTIVGTILAALAAGRFGRRENLLPYFASRLYCLLCISFAHDSFGTELPGRSVLCGRNHSQFLRFLSALFPGTLPYVGSSDRAGFCFQFWPSHRGHRRTANIQSAEILWRQHVKNWQRAGVHLPDRRGNCVAWPGNTWQGSAGLVI